MKAKNILELCTGEIPVIFMSEYKESPVPFLYNCNSFPFPNLVLGYKSKNINIVRYHRIQSLKSVGILQSVFERDQAIYNSTYTRSWSCFNIVTTFICIPWNWITWLVKRALYNQTKGVIKSSRSSKTQELVQLIQERSCFSSLLLMLAEK